MGTPLLGNSGSLEDCTADLVGPLELRELDREPLRELNTKNVYRCIR